VRGAEIVGVQWLSLFTTLALRGVANPAIGMALIRVAWRFRRRHWWRHAPFLPVPATEYVRWRMHTAYGSHHAVPPANDVIRYARWAVRQ
jgi:hypothetical protein